MAQYTTINDQELKFIFQEYGIQNIKNYKALGGGSENTNVLVKTEKGNFVLTICEQKTLQKSIELAQLLEHLSSNEFPTSKIINNSKGEPITVWKNKPLMLKDFLPGKIIKDIPSHLLTQIGERVGALHRIPAPSYLPKDCAYGVKFFHLMEEFEPNGVFTSWLKDIHQYLRPYFEQDLPKALIHSDIFYNNIIIDETESTATIMDFEEACFYYRIFDLGMLFVGVANEASVLNLDIAKQLLKGYKKQIELEPNEKVALKVFTVYAAAATAFWRYKQFHFIHPDPLLFDHYLKMKNLADQVRGLPDDCF